MVYKLMAEYKKEGTLAFKPKKVGRPSQKVNRDFEVRVVSLRKETEVRIWGLAAHYSKNFG